MDKKSEFSKLVIIRLQNKYLSFKYNFFFQTLLNKALIHKITWLATCLSACQIRKWTLFSWIITRYVLISFAPDRTLLAHLPRAPTLRATRHGPRARACHGPERRSAGSVWSGAVILSSLPGSLWSRSAAAHSRSAGCSHSSGTVRGAETWTRAQERCSTAGATRPTRR